ncbi:MAG: hypothetical protein LBV28_04810 [Puniceicoccales bacterium]|jgi:cell division protein FtsZ|nr:hypothetical protein [Puniceicoccales bacterium]
MSDAIPFSPKNDGTESAEANDATDGTGAFATTHIPSEAGVRVKIIGVGDAGASTLARIALDAYPAVRRAVVNTDVKALAASPVEEKLNIGRAVTRGLSTGGETAIGFRAADTSRPAVERLVADTDLVFLVAGLGGGTGSGAAPVLAEIASRARAMVIAFVTMPFAMEGARRSEQAQSALTRLRMCCDVVVPIYNDLLMSEAKENTSVLGAFSLADAWVGRGIRALCAMLFKEGLINIDFAALRGAFTERDGRALFALGSGSGPEAAYLALSELLESPLLQRREARQASTLVVSIQGGPELTLPKVKEIVAKVSEKFGGRENTVLSAIIDEACAGTVEICALGSAGGVRQRPAALRPVPSAAVAEKPSVPSPVGASVPSVASAPVDVAEPVPSVPLVAAVPRKTIAAALKAVGVSVPLVPEPLSPPARSGKRKPEQVEMNFVGKDDCLGIFAECKSPQIDGQDVDVPTFVRRGIQIVL